MTEAEFYHALLVVLAVGSAIMGLGALGLFFVFRRFGGAKA
jgi:hypothetical protein